MIFLKTLSILAISLPILAACSGSDGSSTINSVDNCDMATAELDVSSHTAVYCASFEAKWAEPNFINIPGKAHFTNLIGAAVNDSSDLWSTDSLASAGMELLAEQGKTGDYQTEIKNAINENNAQSLFLVKGTGATGTTHFLIELNRDFSHVNFATMIAPSPDWFVGLSAYSLLNESAEWLSSIEIDLPAYDAGTEVGNSFSLDGTATDPAAAIDLLTETVAGLEFVNGDVEGNSIASITFKRIE